MPHKPRRDRVNHPSASRGSKPPGSGDPCPAQARVDRVDVEREINRLASLPSHVERDLRRLCAPCSSMSFMVRTLVPRRLATAVPGRLPYQPPMPIWTRFLGWQLGSPTSWWLWSASRDRAFMRRPEPRRRVHPLIHILLLDIDMAVDMDDADIAVDMRRDPRALGKPRLWSPPQMTGKAPEV